jgi:zeaxanthin epoxidase
MFAHLLLLQPVLQYLIFPAQFAYLYSYHPTGSMGDLPADLEEKWRKQHIKDAEEAFSKVAVEGQSASAPSFFKIAETEQETVAA